MLSRWEAKAGFSLTEMSTALAVMLLMTVLAVSSVVNRMPGYRLDESIQQVSGDLMAARSLAAAINEEVTVFFDGDGAYRIWADHNGNEVAEEREVQRCLLEHREEVDLYGHPRTLTFRPTGRLAKEVSFVYVAARSNAGYEHFYMVPSGQIIWPREGGREEPSQ